MTECSPRPDEVVGARDVPVDGAPSPGEALAMYRLTARLVELQLELAEQGRTDPGELAVTHDVLVGTRRVLLAALQEADREPQAVAKTVLQVVAGGGGRGGSAEIARQRLRGVPLR